MGGGRGLTGVPRGQSQCPVICDPEQKYTIRAGWHIRLQAGNEKPRKVKHFVQESI